MHANATIAVEELPAVPLVERPLRTHFAWTLAGNLVYAACQWGMLIVLARVGDTTMVGEFSLALAITGPVFLFAGLNTRMVQAADARGDFQLGDYLGLRLITSVLAWLIVPILALMETSSALAFFTVLAVGLAKWLESLSDVLFGFFQRHDQMDRIARAMILKGLLSLACLGGLVALTGNLALGALGLAVAWALVLIFYEAPAAMAQAPLMPTWDFRALGRLAYLAFPLGLVMFLVSLVMTLPRFFVNHEFGLKALGVFGALSYLMVAGSTVVNALGQAATPRLARRWSEGDLPGFWSLFGKLMALVIAMGLTATLASWLFGDWILAILYGQAYAEHHELLAWLMLAATVGFAGSILGYGLTAAKIFRSQVGQFIVVNMMLLAGCWLWIPSFGMIGAAWALLAAYGVQTAIAAVMFVIASRPVRGTS